MISLGSRPLVALAIALPLGLGACTGDDGGDDRADTFSSMSGDGDGDELEGDGDGDGDPTGDGDPSGDGDGDGDPTTGDGDGDPSGDGDGDGGCPGTAIYSGTLEFYNDGSSQGPFELVGCEPFGSSFTPGMGTVVIFSVLDGDGTLTISIPAGATEGQHELDGDYSAHLMVTAGLPPGWLGQYYIASGTIDLVDYFEIDGKEITVDLTATLEHDTDPGRFVDIELSFVATI